MQLSARTARTLLLAAVLVGGPAAGQAPEPPAHSVSLNTALDSAVLLDRLRLLPRLPGGGRAVVKLSFTPAGALDSTTVMTPDRIAPEQLAPLLDALRSTARVLAPDSTRTYFDVALTTGPSAVLAEPRYSKPELLGGGSLSRALQAFVRRHPELFVRGPRSAIVKFLQLPNGQTDKITVERSSGSVEVDAEAVRVVAGMRFRPGRAEGHPIPVWIILPVSFESDTR